MGIQRENIMALIGGRRYHSCILTTFSFDFYFFEMKAMKWLRSCGVRNINVFIDGHYYSELMQQATGEEMQLTPGYSIYPVFQTSIFHPKIWMLFGEKEGLLIIGSGNLTNSGNGNNDEIWGAFHFDIRSTENAHVFSAAWTYISMISEKVRGHMHEKTTSWVVEHSKWLKELPKIRPFQFSDASKGEKVAFLYNSEDTSIWAELSKNISTEKIIEITSISPFYDLNGKALLELKARFPASTIKVVIDESGLIPSSMRETKGFIFYHWKDAGVSRIQYAKSEGTKSKLHGKILHFKTKGGREFCLFGSANVTPEGLGMVGKKSNSEASLLVQSEKGGLLNELGIHLKQSQAVKLSDFKVSKSSSVYEKVLENNQFKIKLFSAEIIYNELTIYSEGNFTQSIKVFFYDKKNRLISTQDLTNYGNELKIELKETLSSIQYVQFVNSSNQPISNKLLVSDYFLIAKTHPNPKTENIERIYTEIQNGDLSRVLDLLHFAIIDETEIEEGGNVLHHRKNKDSKIVAKKSHDALYDLSAYKPIVDSRYEKSLLLSSLSLRVLDLLKIIHQKGPTHDRQNEMQVDEQEGNLDQLSGNEEAEIKAAQKYTASDLKAEKRKLNNYLDSLYESQQDILYHQNQLNTYKPTLTDLTRYLIALELILEYGGKFERYDEQGTQMPFWYLPFDVGYDNDNVKGCCLNLIGDFLMLTRQGFKEYEFEYTRKKVEELKQEAIVATIVCLVNNKWEEEEMHYFYSMALNTFHYLGWKDEDTFNNKVKDLTSKINLRVSTLKQRVYGIEQNLKTLIELIIPAFKKVISRIANKSFDKFAKKGQIIYKSPWGYSYVHSVANGNTFTLVRAGFLWDNDKEAYMRHSTDRVYSPLYLPSFICVEL